MTNIAKADRGDEAMMQTIETTHIEPQAQLSPCPFCGAEPFWIGHVIGGPSGRVEPHFYHPGVTTDTDCVLSGQGHSLDEVKAWNTRSSAPQEPDDARDIQLLIEYAVNGDPPIPVNLERWRFAEQVLQRLFAQGRIAASLKVQEPVADDDAEWLRKNANSVVYGLPLKAGLRIAAEKRLLAIANRLQAKAPETGETP